jgi:hypothetical protein
LHCRLLLLLSLLRRPLVERFVALLLLRRLTLRVLDKLLRGCRCDECKTNGDCCGMTAIGEKTVRPLLAGQRPSNPAVATLLANLQLRLLGDLQSIVDLDTEVPDGTFELRVPEQQLDGTQALCPPVDQRRFRAAQGMRTVGCRVNR